MTGLCALVSSCLFDFANKNGGIRVTLVRRDEYRSALKLDSFPLKEARNRWNLYYKPTDGSALRTNQ